MEQQSNVSEVTQGVPGAREPARKPPRHRNTPIVLEAPFQVCTPGGRRLAEIGCDTDGTAYLRLYDANGEATIELNSGDGYFGGRVSVMDPRGGRAVELVGGNVCGDRIDGRGVNLNGSDGMMRASFYVGADDIGIIHLASDEENFTTIAVPDPVRPGGAS